MKRPIIASSSFIGFLFFVICTHDVRINVLAKIMRQETRPIKTFFIIIKTFLLIFLYSQHSIRVLFCAVLLISFFIVCIDLNAIKIYYSLFIAFKGIYQKYTFIYETLKKKTNALLHVNQLWVCIKHYTYSLFVFFILFI